MARLVDPQGSRTLLQGLASHKAASATSHEGVSTTPTVIGTIHGPGVPRHIAAVGGSIEPVVSSSTSREGESNIFMVVEDNDEIIEVGTAQGFPPNCRTEEGEGGSAQHLKRPRNGWWSILRQASKRRW